MRRPGRKDVEGLRGLAVLAVVLYHAGVGGGGYAGVDVFYVLSGYLITGQLVHERERTGRVRLAAFWGRRARRLLPAAAVVVVSTAAASALLLSPLRAREVLKDAVACAFYAGNYRFALQQTDYLASTAPPSPLLHLWSLGVEEQFYLVWPVLLVAAGRATRRTLLLGASAVAAASLALCVHLTATDQPWAFFSLPTRAWEPAAGALVALSAPALARLPARVAAATGWAGLAAVAATELVLTPRTPFPGTAALLPVLGAAAVLAAGSAGWGGGARLLGAEVLQRLGALSYSWYLWHWPLLVLAPTVLDGPLTVPVALLVSLLALALATATRLLLEEPVRHAPVLVRRPAASLALGGLLTATAAVTALALAAQLPPLQGSGPVVGAQALVPPRARPAGQPPAPAASPALTQAVAAVAAGVATAAVPADLHPGLAHASADKARPFVDGCHLSFRQTRPGRCVYGDPDGRTTVALVGDSHATQWFPAFQQAALEQHWRLVVLAKAVCPPFPLPLYSPVLGRDYRECTSWRTAVAARLAAEHPALVVLGVARHYSDVYGFTVYGRPWLDALGTQVATLRAAGSRVLVMGPTPKPPSDVPDCLSEHLQDARACTFARTDAVDAGGERAEQAVVRRRGGSYADVPSWICTPARCAVVVRDLLVYRDDNHLTTSWPRWLTPLVLTTAQSALRAPAAR